MRLVAKRLKVSGAGPQITDGASRGWAGEKEGKGEEKGQLGYASGGGRQDAKMPRLQNPVSSAGWRGSARMMMSSHHSARKGALVGGVCITAP